MHRKISTTLAVAALFATYLAASSTVASAADLKVVSNEIAGGFTFPESVGCDAEGQVLYVSEFGSELKPTQMDGKGRISKVSLDGKILEAQFLPAAGQVLNKPKGQWISGGRMWVTDIDSVWEFDLKSKKGRKIALPGIKFANDPTIVGNALYVSDNRGDQLYRVEPAEFLDMAGEPKVSVVFTGKAVNPNGVYPARDGSLLMVGFKSKEEARGIYVISMGGEPRALSNPIGRLDGIYQMSDGDLLASDWNSGSLFRWSAMGGMEKLVEGLKGPADFCVLPQGDGLLVALPELPGSQLRIIKLAH